MRAIQQLAVGFVVVLSPILVFSQTLSTGRITGVIRDAQGALIAGAEIEIQNLNRGEKRSATTDRNGSYSVALLSHGNYDIVVRSQGFRTALFRDVRVMPGEATNVDAVLNVAQTSTEVSVTDARPMVRSQNSALSTTLEAHTVNALPLATRNLLQVLTLTPGVTAPLINNNAIGRNSPNVSVDGSRVTQNGYEINGVDATDRSLHVFADVAVPAPESVGEVTVQTSMYDASASGAGASVQVITKNGTNLWHGAAYEYFRNEAFNANDANLKAAGVARPEMRRNVYGGILGGPVRKDNAFFFFSYQGTREANGATDQSIYKSALIAPGLTDDRSAATLMSTFRVPTIDPISLNLLNARLPNGHFLIPTPQTSDGLVTGTALSTYREEQFNTNFDWHLTADDLLTAKFFWAHAPLFSAISGSNFGTPSSLPGFGTYVVVDNRVLSLQQTHIFSPTTVNEIRFGYHFLRHDEAPQESLLDSAIGISRSTAGMYPGLPLILLGRDQGASSVGTSDITYRGNVPSVSIADMITLRRQAHNIRMGGELLHSEWRARAGVFSYGEIDFPTFQDFLTGNTGISPFDGGSGFAHLGTGISDRNFITTDYHFFVQDDWKIRPALTLNAGVRYELDPPPYDSRGRIGGFDPALYRARMEADSNGLPVGPPLAGVIEAGNALPQYSLPGVTRVSKRMLKSIDRNNFGPRIGLAWSPLSSGRLAVRAGYGIFYQRPSFIYLGLEYFSPPFFLDTDTSGQAFSSPFGIAPPDSSFPLLQPGSFVTGTTIDRNARTPYTQQFNSSVQFEPLRSTTVQVAYAGSRGVKLFRSVNANQARIASLNHPITNAVTGQQITVNSIENAFLRAPMQAVSTVGFALNETNAQSTYHSLQASVNRRFEHGVEFSASYTFSKSIDNASGPGGGANLDGTLDRGGGLDTGSIWGNQLDPRANRGVSDFDRTHYFTFSYVWELPKAGFARSRATRLLFADWELSGIVTAMSGLPVDVFDPTGGYLYGLFFGARPNWAPGAGRKSAISRVPAGYCFNPSAFTQALIPPGQVIPSAHDPTAVVDPTAEAASDIGDVGRNVLRGPAQANLDFSFAKMFAPGEKKRLEFRADFFNILNHSNPDNPASDITAPQFGKVVSYSSSPRILQLALKLAF
jgi:carboxypeptidase family protein